MQQYSKAYPPISKHYPSSRLPKFPRTHRGDILPFVVVAKKHCAQILSTMRALLYAHNLYVSVKLTSLYCGLRLILVYPNPQ